MLTKIDSINCLRVHLEINDLFNVISECSDECAQLAVVRVFNLFDHFKVTPCKALLKRFLFIALNNEFGTVMDATATPVPLESSFGGTSTLSTGLLFTKNLSIGSINRI